MAADALDIGAIAADIISQKWIGLVERLVALAKELYETIKCFKNASDNKIKDVLELVMKIAQMSGDTKDCVIQQLEDAMVNVKKALRDALEGNADALAEDVQKISDDLQFAINNC